MNKKLLIIGLITLGLVAGVGATKVTDSNTWHYTDTFEDNDLSEYTVSQGDSSEFTTSTASSYLGTYGMDLDNNDGDEDFIINTQQTVEQGQTISGYTNQGGGEAKILFGATGTSSSDTTFSISYGSGSLYLRERDVDDYTNVNTLDQKSVTIPTSTWVRYEIHWLENGTINAELYNEETGEFIGEVTGEQTRNVEKGYTGFGSVGAGVYFDGNPAISEHYVNNGGLEQGDGSSTGWETGTGSRTNTESYSGDYSWQVSSATWAGVYRFTTPDSLGLQQVDENYKLEFYAKNTDENDHSISIWCSQASGGTGYQGINANTGWQKYEVSYSPDSNCGSPSHIGMNNQGFTTGSVYFDQMSLYKVSGSEDPSQNYWSEDWGFLQSAHIFDGTLSTNRWTTSANGGAYLQQTGKDAISITGTVETTGGADGFIVNMFGEDFINNRKLAGGLSVDFDHYNDQIEIREGATTLASTSYNIPDSGTDMDFTVRGNRNTNEVYVSIDGSLVLSHTYDESNEVAGGDFIGFTGWTGGVSSQHLIKDVEVYDTTGGITDYQHTGQQSSDDPFHYWEDEDPTSGGTWGNGIVAKDEASYFKNATMYDINENVMYSESYSPIGTLTHEISPGDGGFTYQGSYYWVAWTNDGVRYRYPESNIDYLETSFDHITPGYSGLRGDTSTTDTADLTGDVSDDKDLREIRIFVEGSQVDTINVPDTSDTSYSFSYTTQPRSDGFYDWSIEVEDEAGNTETSTTSSFTIDTTAPTINQQTVSDTQGGADETVLSSSNPWFSVSANDAVTGVSEYTLYVDGVEEFSSTSSSETQVSGLSDGNHSYYWEVQDNAGNTRTSSTETFEVDTADPTFDTKATVNGDNVTLLAENLSESVEEVTFNHPNLQEKTVTSPPYEVTYTDVADGLYSVDVIATDEAGNTGAETVSFTVDTTNPSVNTVSASQILLDVELDVDVSDNVNLDRLEVLVDGSVERTEQISGPSYSNTYTFTNLSSGNHVFKVNVYDTKDNTDSANTSLTVDLEAPEYEASNVYVEGDNTSTASSWSDNYVVELNTTDANNLLQTSLNGIDSGVAVQLVADEKLTEWVYISNPTKTDSITLNPENFFSEEYLKERNGEIQLNVQLTDEFGNSRTVTSIDTDLLIDNEVDFSNWLPKSTIGESRFEFSFDSNDNLTTIDADVYLHDSNPLLNFSYSPEPKECVLLEPCTGTKLLTYDNDYEVVIQNPTQTRQVLYYRDEEITDIPAGNSITLKVESGNSDDTDENATNKIYGSGEVSVENFEDRFETDIVYGDLPTSEWTQEGSERDWSYSSETTVPSQGLYNVKIYLEDEFGNNRTVTKQARIRPDTFTGNLYQSFVNAGISDFYIGLVILFFIPTALLVTELKTLGTTFITQIGTVAWAVGGVVLGFYPPQVNVVALFLAGILVATMSRKIYRG